MSRDTYDGAVETFETLLKRAVDGRHRTPASLIRAAGLPASSGYRHVIALEAEGFLRRDQNRDYLPGRMAARTGMHAFGIGQIAPVAETIVTQLRQSTQHSAFLGIVGEQRLQIGTHSSGRTSQGMRIHRQYFCEDLPSCAQGSCAELGLRYIDDGIARRLSALVAHLPGLRGPWVVLGLFLDRPVSDAAALGAILMDSCRRLDGMREAAR